MRKPILVVVAAVVLAALAWLAWLAMRDGQSGALPNAGAPSPMGIAEDNAPAMSNLSAPKLDSSATATEWKTQLTGTVFAPSGVAAAAADVLAWITDDTHACHFAKGGTPLRVQTSAEGEFALSLSEEETYCIQARHPEWANSEPKQVRFEATNAIELRLVLQAAQHVSGRVVDGARAPVSGVALEITSGDSPIPTSRRTETDATGAFTFLHLTPGEYALTSVDARYAVSHPEQIAISAGQPLDSLIVTVYKLVWISGRAVDANGKPIADAQVTARSPYSEALNLGRTHTNVNGEFKLASQHRSPKATIAQRMLERGAVDAKGNERLLPLQNPTRVCLEVSHAQWGSATKSVTPGEEAFDADAFYLTGRNALVRGVLVDRVGDPISGHLRFKQSVDARQAASASCESLPAERQVTADNQGRFAVQLPMIGRYEVEVTLGGGFTQTVLIELGGGRELRIQLE